MSLTNSNPKSRWIFKNSLKLNLKKLDKPVTHKVLFDALDVTLTPVENDAITSIYNFSSNKIWIIEFEPTFDAVVIFDREINIKGTYFKLEDANKVPDPRKFCIFRFHFLPTDFDNHLLKNFFNAVRINGLKIEQMSEEKYKDRPERKNGVRRVKISYPKEVDNIIQSLTGPTIMYGLKCVVSIVGQKQKCYFCDDEGHNIAKCPVKDSTCESCHQKGHLTKKCSIAEKLKSLEKMKIDFSELEIEQDETDTNHEGEPSDDDVKEKPNTPEYQPDTNDSIDSRPALQADAQFLKTPVFEDHLRVFKQLNQQENVTPTQVFKKNESKDLIRTKNQIKRRSESEPHKDDRIEDLSDTNSEDENIFDPHTSSTRSVSQGGDQYKKQRKNTVTKQPACSNNLKKYDQ